MSDFHFANPNWSKAIWVILIVLAVLAWLDWRRGELLSRFVSEPMQQRLACRLSRSRRWLSLACLGLACVALVTALMRPQIGLTFLETPRAGAQIMVCLDVSNSMLAEDTAPNRLERAKAEIADLLSYLRGDQVGLIAFAGRAAVLCPLTPDYGFLKMILESTGPHSVGLGGTRLEVPIRKGVDGFRSESDISRVLILITDGEDHDSHPLDAAKTAAERGIKVLAIGFGDEAGSEIFVTDPKSGARTQVLDGDGRPVRSRLDGQTLRDIALATDGAYIPAGTGALDLKSIYDAHIAPLVRGQMDGRAHAVRRDVFQWAVLAGLLFLAVSIALGSGSVRSELGLPRESKSKRSVLSRTSSRSRRKPLVASSTFTSALALFAACSFVSFPCEQVVHAQPASNQPSLPQNPVQKATANPSGTNGTVQGASPASITDKADQKTDTRDKADSSDNSKPIDPREVYNQAVGVLPSDCDSAERFFSEARRDAGTDGDVRFRATYNLGMVEVQRADRVIGSKPTEALEHFRKAADWFRDASRLRPDDRDSRHNLEIVLRRILELNDSLTKKDDRDLAKRLDESIEAERSLVAASRQLVDRISAHVGKNSGDADSSEEFRGDFRQLAVDQRKVITDCQAFSGTAREELESLKKKDEKDRSAEENVRIAQLGNLLHYTNQADQRLGQSHGQMRRRQGERSFRRAAAGLNELKRARDQLRNPVELLDVLIADASSSSQLTAVAAVAKPIGSGLPSISIDPKVDASRLLPDVSAFATPPVRPSWLTREYLEESLLSLTQRLEELNGNMAAGLDETKQQPDGTSSESKTDGQAEKFLELVREALPLLKQGHSLFEAATKSLTADDFNAAANQQDDAIGKLHKAREVFLDVRGLVELAFAQESTVQQLLTPEQSTPDSTTRSEPMALATGSQPMALATGVEIVAQKSQNDQHNFGKSGSSGAATRHPWLAPSANITAQRLGAAQEYHAQNEPRVARIAKLIDEQLSELPKVDLQQPAPSQDQAAPGQPSTERTAAQRKQFEMAKEMADAARSEMAAATGELKKMLERTTATKESKEPSDTDRIAADARSENADATRGHVAQSVEHLQSLRRLFFSIVQHLQETAQRQAQLNDQTEQVAGIEQDVATRMKVGQFRHRQDELGLLAEQIAKALEEQGHQSTPPPPSDAQAPLRQQTPPLEQHNADQIARQFVKAAELVNDGRQSMKQAAQQLSAVAENKSAPDAEQDSKTTTEAEPKSKAEPKASVEPKSKADAKAQTEPQAEQKSELRPDQTHSGIAPARKSQDAALQKLVEALALLKPPEQQKNDESKDNQDQQNQQAQQPDQQKQAEQQKADGDPSRLLQAVRDREEAQRRRDKDRRQAAGRQPVDKDW